MRVTQLLAMVVASLGLLVAPLATLHAHVASDHHVVTVHGGHGHDGAVVHHADHRHDADHYPSRVPDLWVHADVASDSPIHAEHSHVVYCDAVAMQGEQSRFDNVRALAPAEIAQTRKPDRHAHSLVAPRDTEFIVGRPHLQPPLRGPPR